VSTVFAAADKDRVIAGARRPHALPAADGLFGGWGGGLSLPTVCQ